MSTRLFFLKQPRMAEKVIFKLHRIARVSVCVSRSRPRILSLCYRKWQSYIKITFFFCCASLRLECQGCRGGAPRSCRLLWVWAGRGPRGLERFYQQKEDTTAAPNTEAETKHALGTPSKWLCRRLMFHVTVTSLDSLVALGISKCCKMVFFVVVRQSIHLSNISSQPGVSFTLWGIFFFFFIF